MKQTLVFNVGASSIKYAIFKNLEKVKSGKYERLKSRDNYKRAFVDLFKNLKKTKIDQVIHRVVLGGEISKPQKITPKIKAEIKKYSSLAPLHNPVQLMIINLSEKFKVNQYAVFDNSFFVNLPEFVKTYAIDAKLTQRYNIRKYGFHGISHKSVSRGLKGKTITCHIGDGVSCTAIKAGKPLDTTMGFTPMEGLMMGTRSGSVDPGLIMFLAKKGIKVSKVLTKDSGLKGVSGYSDFRDIIKTFSKKESKLAYNMIMYQLTKQIGAYTAVMNGVDNIVFTGAIGSHVSRLRSDIVKHLEFLGAKLDEKKNKGDKEIISSKASKITIYVRHPNEEEAMLREVIRK